MSTDPMFFSNGAMLAQLLLLAWAALVLYLGLRVVRYRRKCRRAVEHNAPIPIPSRSTARFRGAAPLCYALIALGIGISLFISISDSHTTFEGGSTLTTGDSVFGQAAEYRRFSEEDGDLWVESYDCRTSWLAGIICDDLRAIEGDQGRLNRYFHLHSPAGADPGGTGLRPGLDLPLGRRQRPDLPAGGPGGPHRGGETGSCG